MSKFRVGVMKRELSNSSYLVNYATRLTINPVGNTVNYTRTFL